MAWGHDARQLSRGKASWGRAGHGDPWYGRVEGGTTWHCMVGHDGARRPMMGQGNPGHGIAWWGDTAGQGRANRRDIAGHSGARQSGARRGRRRHAKLSQSTAGQSGAGGRHGEFQHNLPGGRGNPDHLQLHAACANFQLRAASLWDGLLALRGNTIGWTEAVGGKGRDAGELTSRAGKRRAGSRRKGADVLLKKRTVGEKQGGREVGGTETCQRDSPGKTRTVGRYACVMLFVRRRELSDTL